MDPTSICSILCCFPISSATVPLPMDLDDVEMEVNTSTSGSSNPGTDSESDEIPDAGALNSDDSDTPYVYKHRVDDGIAPARVR